MNYLIPHSQEWFSALAVCYQDRAIATRQILKLTGRTDVCSICGEAPATDYKVMNRSFTEDTGATARLCEYCRAIRQHLYNDCLVQLLPNA
jgi:hypothetical protein